MTISRLAVHRKARVTKIRRKNIKTDIFAEANKVGCRTEPTKKTLRITSAYILGIITGYEPSHRL